MTHETIVMSDADRYLDMLEQMVASARPRAAKDPTLGVILSVTMLDLLVTEVRNLRAAEARETVLQCEHRLRTPCVDRNGSCGTHLSPWPV